jgi:RNA polymerase sigma factor (sigma-70 family)
MQTQHLSSRLPSDLTDGTLIQQAQCGDQGAFEMLVDRYSDVLFRLIARILQDEHLAHDVLQHVFLQLYRSLPTLQPGGTIKSWLCQVARHRCIDELRRKRPLFFSEIGDSADEEAFLLLIMLPDTGRPPEEQAELLELRQQLLKAIEQLPPRMRTVVLLRYAHQLSFNEIGQVLSIPASTAKTCFNRAKKPLRPLLEAEYANYRGMEIQ